MPVSFGNYASISSLQVGFIGLGAMGARQAKTLQHEGYSLVVYDRSITQLEGFNERDNVEVASSPAALAGTEGTVSRRFAVSSNALIFRRRSVTLTHPMSL